MFFLSVISLQSAKIAIKIELQVFRVAFFDIFIIFFDMLKGSAPIDALPQPYSFLLGIINRCRCEKILKNHYIIRSSVQVLGFTPK